MISNSEAGHPCPGAQTQGSRYRVEELGGASAASCGLFLKLSSATSSDDVMPAYYLEEHVKDGNQCQL